MTAVIPFRALSPGLGDVRYLYGPDSERQRHVEPGLISEITFEESDAFPGTLHRCWVHVPAAYDGSSEVALMVFNDGWWYLDPAGEVRAAIVLDNLIARGEMPVTISVFVDPGVATDPDGAMNRNVEYDTFDERYSTFVLDEVIPAVAERFRIVDDARRRGICGGSSGGNAAVIAAWKRPDAFSRVIAYVPSFGQIPGGNPFPRLIATEPRKPLRLFLQAAHRDEGWDRPRMNQLAENLEVAAAFARSGYDFRLVLGDGGHSPNHGGVLLPDALRWIWRDDERVAPCEGVS